MPFSPLHSLNGHDASDHEHSVRDLGKRGRGLTTSGGVSTSTHAPRTLRALSNRIPDESNGVDKAFDRGTASNRSHNRGVSSPAENSLSRLQSYQGSISSSLVHSPVAFSPTQEGFQEFPLHKAAVHVASNDAVSTSPLIPADPLREVATSDSLDGATTVGSSAVDSAKTDSRTSRPKSQSYRKDGSMRSGSRRPSNIPVVIQTVGDYAQEHLFTSFVSQADQKINHCNTAYRLQIDFNVEEYCGPGIDLGFDQLLSAIGHVVREKPRPMVERIMQWRENYLRRVGPPRHDSNQTRTTPELSNDSNGSLPQKNMNSQNTLPTSKAIADAEFFSTDRRSYVVTYLFSRVMMPILAHTDQASLTLPLIEKLEFIAYTTLRALNFGYLGRFPLKRTQWKMMKDLLELLSALDFEGVSSKFLADLRVFQKTLSVKASASKSIDNEASHLLKSMRHLRLPTDSGTPWSRSCNFVQTVTELFAEVHGQPAKMAYCKMIGGILLTIGDQVHTDFDNELWRKTVGRLNERLSQLASKPKYWQVAYPVQATLACVSPYEYLLSRWQGLTGTLSTKLRERNNRATALKATCRLLWSYLQRSRDSRDTMLKHIDDLARIVFFSGKRYSLSLEPAVAEPLIQLIRIVGWKAHELCMKTIIFPLLNYELLQARDIKDLKVEQLDPDKTSIAIRAFLAVLADIENNDMPPFPKAFDDERLSDSGDDFGPVGMIARAYPYKPDRLSKPVITSKLSEAFMPYYTSFCWVLGKITIVTSDVFGGQAALDDKLPAAAPKTPIADAWAFRRDDGITAADERASFFELLRVAIQALPRCLVNQPSLNSIFSILCSGTVHLEKGISMSSNRSLLSIARQGHAHIVIERFSNFIITYDQRSFSIQEGLKANWNGLEIVLRLYIDLLYIWKDEVHSKNAKSGVMLVESPTTRSAQFDFSAIWTQIDRVESHGLLFLSSPSNRIRLCAVEILALITKFDITLGKPNPRIATILEGDPSAVLCLPDETLTSWERSRLERGRRRSHGQSTLIDLACSPGEHDADLWIKLFPNFVRAAFEQCPVTVTQTREDVCSRLSLMHTMVETLDERQRVQSTQATAFDGSQLRQPRNIPIVSSPMTISQWKLYLMFACTTLTRAGGGQVVATQDSAHTRKTSRSSQSTQESISTARDLFGKVIPLLSAFNTDVRDAAVIGLGSININLYKPLLESIDIASRISAEDPRKSAVSHQRVASSPRRAQPSSQFQAEIVQVYRLTAHFLSNPEAYKDEWILGHISHYTRGLSMILRTAEDQWDYQRLRIGYCGLVEGFYLGIIKSADQERWMSFGARRAAFSLMEEWCGHPNGQDMAKLPSFETSPRPGESDDAANQRSTRAQEQNQLRIVALSAMATLCAGPVRLMTERTSYQFDPGRMLQWIHSMFKSESDKTHATGRRALKNLILHNTTFPILLERTIDKLYIAETAKGLESYIDVVSDVLMGEGPPKISYFKIFSALLFILGNERSSIRRKSARLLRFLDEQEAKGSKLQDLDISISDKTTAVNKKAQFEISQRLALQHSEQAFSVFSEFSKHFNQLNADHKRNIVLALLPWMKTLELQLDPSGGPTGGSYMLLVNLLKMTIDQSSNLHHEIQALWQALATGPHAGNVKLILDFIIDLCLQRRDEKLVQVSKQVVVFLSSTPAGLKVIESLILQIGPTTMWEDKSRTVHQPEDATRFPYLADLTHATPESTNQFNMSLGHLCLILLVDLVVAPVVLPVEKVTLLLHTLLILWDHRMDVVRTQARELLVHLMHELVIAKMDDADLVQNMPSIEDFLELIRRHDARVVWSYEDNNGVHSRFPLSESIVHVVTEVIRVFSFTYPGIQDAWGTITLDWATRCPVRHLACRSLQIYRCILTPLDRATVVQILQRLYTSVSDEDAIFQTYSIDLVRTLRTVVDSSNAADVPILPLLFWATCACLDSAVEVEFLEAVAMLDSILSKFNLGDSAVVALLIESKPLEFKWPADLLSGLVYKGCRSEAGIAKCLDVLTSLIQIPSNPIVGDDLRLLYIALANIPRMTRSFEDPTTVNSVRTSAKVLAEVARIQVCTDLAQVLDEFAAGKIHHADDFLPRAIDAIKAAYFPVYEAGALKFLMGLLPNNISWFRQCILQMITIVIPGVDLKKLEIAEQGPDLFSPLLRLLQTDLAPIALTLLDSFLAVPGLQISQHQLAMSMMGSRASRQFRKPYDRLQSIYGIPDESGWSVPMPAARKDAVRNNVMAICRSFSETTAPGSPGIPTPEVEFYKEDHAFGSYFPERSGTMTSDEAFLAETNMGELLEKLDTLDDFFETGGGQQARPSPTYPYARSSASTPSGSIRKGHFDSFPGFAKSGHPTQTNGLHGQHEFYTDSRPTTATRDLGVMSPSAFNVSPRAMARPGIPPRSSTSPAVNQRTPPDKLISSAIEEAEPFFSDDETSFGRTSTSDGSIILEKHRFAAQRQKLPSRTGIRSGVRRLISGEHRLRSSSPRLRIEPEVPKVPDIYRQNIRSSDL